MTSLLSRLRSAGFSRKQAQTLDAELDSAASVIAAAGMLGKDHFSHGQAMFVPSAPTGVASVTLTTGPEQINAGGRVFVLDTFRSDGEDLTIGYMEAYTFNANKTESIYIWSNSPITVPADDGADYWRRLLLADGDFGVDVQAGVDLSLDSSGDFRVVSAGGGLYSSRVTIQFTAG